MQATSSPQNNPLEQLKDIHVPDGVESWPLDWGWWSLGAIILLLLVLAVWWLIKRQRFNKPRKEAMAVIKAISVSEENWPFLINSALKRVALTYFPPNDIASLSGKPWVAFMLNKVDAKTSNQIKAGLVTLQDELYVAKVNNDNFSECCRSALMWLDKANLKHQTSNAQAQPIGGSHA